jgi:hypothetical protein
MGRKQGMGGSAPPSTTALSCEPRFLGSAVFAPEIVKEMGEAFDLAWATMLASKHACAAGDMKAETRRQLACAIIQAARTGTSDRARLSKSALRCLFPLGLDGQASQPEPRFLGAALLLDGHARNEPRLLSILLHARMWGAGRTREQERAHGAERLG